MEYYSWALEDFGSQEESKIWEQLKCPQLYSPIVMLTQYQKTFNSVGLRMYVSIKFFFQLHELGSSITLIFIYLYFRPLKCKVSFLLCKKVSLPNRLGFPGTAPHYNSQ